MGINLQFARIKYNTIYKINKCGLSSKKQAMLEMTIKRFFSLLMKIIQAGLPQPYYLGLTRNAEIDGLKLFKTSTSHTRAETHRV